MLCFQSVLYCIVLYNDVFTFLYVAVGNKLLLLRAAEKHQKCLYFIQKLKSPASDQIVSPASDQMVSPASDQMVSPASDQILSPPSNQIVSPPSD